MTILLQQTTQTIMARCHLGLKRQWYAVKEKSIDIESDVWKSKKINVDKYSVWHIQWL